MDNVQRGFRHSLFTLWAVIMTNLTYVLGAPPLKVLRRRLGRPGYWGTTLAISAGLFVLRLKSGEELVDFRLLAILFFSLSTLMGFLEEFEDMGFSLLAGAFFTVLINILVFGGALAIWAFHTGPKWGQTLAANLEAVMKPGGDLTPYVQINYFEFMLYMPAIAVIFWMIAIYLAVLFEGKLSAPDMPVPSGPGSLRSQLTTFSLPDICVWLFIGALLGANVDFHSRALQVVSTNLVCICAMLFLFQGIAVVVKIFEHLRLGLIWQLLFLLFFWYVAWFVGLMDFWLNFRGRLAKRSEEFNREI